MRLKSLAKMGAGAMVMWLIILVAIVIGWVMNILDLVHMSGALTGEGVVRIAGIFIPPLGAFMGYFF